MNNSYYPKRQGLLLHCRRDTRVDLQPKKPKPHEIDVLHVLWAVSLVNFQITFQKIREFDIVCLVKFQLTFQKVREFDIFGLVGCRP